MYFLTYDAGCTCANCTSALHYLENKCEHVNRLLAVDHLDHLDHLASGQLHDSLTCTVSIYALCL